MRHSTRAFLLGPLLKSVSRSFYLTLNVLPAGMRDPVGLAYLLARAADTIADTSLIAPEERLALLLSLRAQVNGMPDAAALARIASQVGAQQTVTDERILLESLGSALDILAQLDARDREAVRAIVTTLTEGMEFDLRTFPDERSGSIVALPSRDALDRYTYLVAGCVGEFWTQMTYAHVPGALQQSDEAVMLARGVHFGKALQMTNVLRDCAKDLRIGRCYLPLELLAPQGLAAADLLAGDASQRARSVLLDLLKPTLDHYREAVAYTLALPSTSMRLRLACIWPIAIGLDTLALLVDNADWLDPSRVSKVQRGDVYRIIARSLPSSFSDAMLMRWFGGTIDRIEAQRAALAAAPSTAR